MTWENEHEKIYEAMNLLDEIIQSRGHEAAIDGIEAWLREPDLDRPDFRETLAQGVQDAIAHAANINEGNITITINRAGDEMIRFQWLDGDDEGPSDELKIAAIRAVKQAMKEGD